MNFKDLKEKYNKEISLELKKELSLKNSHSVPNLEKVVVNIGFGRMSQAGNFNDKILPEILKILSEITGQKPSLRPSKKSIAGFKLRQGSPVGAKVTLRGVRAFDFVERLVKIVFPRLRDFKGIDLKNVDDKGNLNLGFKENVVFPEINQDTINADFGFQVTLVARGEKRDHSILFYKKLGFLFKNNKNNG